MPDRAVERTAPHWEHVSCENLPRSWSDPPSESSFKRVLERCGMVEKRRMRKAAESGRIADGRRGAKPERSVDGSTSRGGGKTPTADACR
jgi:hypothetical protein